MSTQAGIIYLITNLVNGKRYVGQTTKGAMRRLQGHHGMAAHHPTMPIDRAIRKYGRENFRCDVLQECQDSKELDMRELHWATELRTFVPVGYNIKAGGPTARGWRLSGAARARMSAVWTKERRRELSAALKGRPISDEAKRRMSDARMGHAVSDSTRAKLSAAHAGKRLAEETKRKISKANTGKVRSEDFKRRVSQFHKGRTQTSEHRQRLSAALKGRIITEEARKKIASALRGRTLSQEQRERISAAMIGNPNVGHPQDEETKAKIRRATLDFWKRKKREASTIQNGGA